MYYSFHNQIVFPNIMVAKAEQRSIFIKDTFSNKVSDKFAPKMREENATMTWKTKTNFIWCV